MVEIYPAQLSLLMPSNWGVIALVLAIASMARDSIAQSAIESIGSYLFGPGIKTVETCSVVSHDVEAELLSLIEECVPDIVNA